MNQFVFNGTQQSSEKGIYLALNALLKGKKPVVICVGSDLAVGDSLGPLTGTFLKNSKVENFVYGDLRSPITAKEVEKISKNVKLLHPNATILVIDAAVGLKEDIGLIKVNKGGIMPGLGVDKNFSLLGDVSIIGVVSEKQNALNNLANNTRLNLIYTLSKNISSSISKYLKN